MDLGFRNAEGKSRRPGRRSPSYDRLRVLPGWYEEAAIILRKLKRPDEEVRILRRAIVDYPDNFAARLAKAEALAARASAV